MTRKNVQRFFPLDARESVCAEIMLKQQPNSTMMIQPHLIALWIGSQPGDFCRYLDSAATTTSGTGGSPRAHWRQSGTVQFEGQLPPSAMNRAAVSAMRLASVCTRTTAAVR